MSSGWLIALTVGGYIASALVFGIIFGVAELRRKEAQGRRPCWDDVAAATMMWPIALIVLSGWLMLETIKVVATNYHRKTKASK